MKQYECNVMICFTIVHPLWPNRSSSPQESTLGLDQVLNNVSVLGKVSFWTVFSHLTEFEIESFSVTAFAEGPKEPLVGRAHSNPCLQQKPHRLLHLSDHQVHSRCHIHKLICVIQDKKQTLKIQYERKLGRDIAIKAHQICFRNITHNHDLESYFAQLQNEKRNIVLVLCFRSVLFRMSKWENMCVRTFGCLLIHGLKLRRVGIPASCDDVRLAIWTFAHWFLTHGPKQRAGEVKRGKQRIKNKVKICGCKPEAFQNMFIFMPQDT